MGDFLEAGADPALTDKYGSSLLHLVAVNSTEDAVERLKIVLNVISDLNSLNQSGQTALDLVRRYDNSQVAHGLERAGE